MLLAEMSATLEQIVTIGVGILSTIVTLFVVPWLRAKKKEADAVAKRADIDARGRLFARLKGFIFRRADALAQRELPEIAKKVRDGRLKTRTDIKVELSKLGGDLFDEAKKYFLNQHIDLAKEVGDDALDKLIRTAADYVNPFPGKETAAMLLEAKVSDMLIERGVVWLRRKADELDLTQATQEPASADKSE